MISLNSPIPFSSISLEVRAVIANGTSKIFSSLLRAVTTISSRAAPSWAIVESVIVKVSVREAIKAVNNLR